MSPGPGTDLQAALRRQLVTALSRARDELEAAGSLSGLGPAGPEWAGTALEHKLLAPLGPPQVANPLAAAVMKLVGQLAGGAPGTVLAELHGWEPAPGAPRGIAYALRVDSGGGSLVFAVHVAPENGGPRLGITGSGTHDPEAATAALGGGWTVTLTGHAAAAFEASVDLDGNLQLGDSIADGDFLRVDFARPDQGERIGAAPGPSVKLGAIAWGGELRVGPGPALARKGWVRTSGGSVELVPGVLSGLIPGLGPLPLTLDVGLDPQAGIALAGSTALEARLPVALTAPGIELDGLDVKLRLDPPPGPSGVNVKASVRTAARVSLPGAPIGTRFEGLGLELPFAWGDLPKLGFDPAQLAPLLPSGAEVDIKLAIIRGSGFIAERGPGEYAGGLSASMPPLSATAFGVLRAQPLSFVVLLGATFPPPGIQVGFGFAVTGMGGVVGVNVRVDRNALLRAVADGSAAKLLFPTDPAAAAQAASSALPALFPPQRGSVVAGPMFQLSWGGRLVSASVAVLMEVSAQPRLTILGKLVVGIPDPQAALILIQVSFAGQIDPGEPSVLIVASMTGSHIVGVPLTGDVCLLSRGGRDATFVLSAGGFHPAFPLPRGVPPLRRIGTDLSPLPVLELRAEAYFAVTTNTVQFGARIELVAMVAKCGLHGHLSVDLLIQFEPLHFIADLSIGIALSVFGEDLVGVGLDLRLEGPAKWHARGRGSIDLFLFSVCFDFDKEWGSAPALPVPPPNVAFELERALADPSAWVVQRPAAGPPGVVLSADADRRLGAGDLVDPYGSLTVRQKVVPLALTIDRFDRIPLGEQQRWDLVDGKLGDRPAPSGEEAREQFARGQYVGLSDDQQLSEPAYGSYRAGFHLTGTGRVSADFVPHTIEFETKVCVPEEPKPQLAGLDLLLSPDLLVAVAAAVSVDHPLWWPDPEVSVSVAEEVPVVAASAWSLTPVDVAASGPTDAELRDAIAADPRPNLMVVEAWEVTA